VIKVGKVAKERARSGVGALNGVTSDRLALIAARFIALLAIAAPPDTGKADDYEL
jgi:hypothetical protein